MFCSCGTDEKRLIEMLNSDKKIEVIKAINYIADRHQTHMVKYLLADAMDPRVTNDLRYKGMSIYKIKMGAMERLTGVKPIKKITYKPDSTVLKFYVDIAVKRGWIDKQFLMSK